MTEKNSEIIVAGDVTIDWLQWEVGPKEDAGTCSKRTPNWALHKGVRMVARPGGALLLAAFVEAANGVPPLTHKLENIEDKSPSEVIHSNSFLELCRGFTADTGAGERAYRVVRSLGFTGPDDRVVKPLALDADDPDAGIVILDDTGNGFRENDTVWPQAILTDGKKPVVLHKMNRPLYEGALWDRLRKKHRKRHVLIISADDLRDCGVNISRRLSWERTALDFSWQINNNRDVAPLADCENLIVRFGIDGAIHYHRINGKITAWLYYDPQVVEDGFVAGCEGKMQGYTCAFVAALSRRIADEGIDGIGEGIREGIKSSRRLLRFGFGFPPALPDYPGDKIFHAVDDEPLVADIQIPQPEVGELGDWHWTILEELTRSGLEQAAYNTVITGSDPVFDRVPAGRFGALRTADRTELESYHSIRNLIVEYLGRDMPENPLSIAVFGPPGSGKSFGVTQLAKSIAPGLIQRLEFNVSQFRSTDDLVDAFNKVQNVVLRGKIPLVFFDEFDSEFDGKLGWLKYFLAPMQDGEFKHGETMHPIGKAIFVFAGGTSHSFRAFSRDDLEGEGADAARGEFVDAKGPDFLSRLRGYVNILGPNPANEEDKSYIIRRAILLRAILKGKARQIFERSGKAHIDQGVLRAFIKVPRYKHGTRSMVAIIEMSLLTGRKAFEQAGLPPKEQLKMHVDDEIFTKLVLRDVLFGDALERLAGAIHERYRQDMHDKKQDTGITMRPWEELPEEYRESNRRQANHIPVKLQRIGYGFSPASENKGNRVNFKDKQIDIMAQMEHEGWMKEKFEAGWTLGDKRDDVLLKHPSLKPWDELPEDEKEKNRNIIRDIPELLSDAGFEIYSL